MNKYELMHYGVKGMKWGVRRRQLKREYRSAVRNAQTDAHRQNAKSQYIAGRKALKAEKKKFNQDVRDYRKDRMRVTTEYEFDKTGKTTKTNKTYYDRQGKKLDSAYMEKVIAANKRRTTAALIGTVAVSIGSTAVLNLLSSDKIANSKPSDYYYTPKTERPGGPTIIDIPESDWSTVR